MEYEIKRLSPDLANDYFDFFDHRAFSDGTPFYPCYCNAFNLSKDRMKIDLYQKAEEYGEGLEGWKRALRESAERMVKSGEIQGYLAYDKGIAAQLLHRVCDDAKAEGYKYVEAYPVKDGGYLGMAFTGPLHLYEKAGFDICTQSNNTYIMRKQLV